MRPVKSISINSFLLCLAMSLFIALYGYTDQIIYIEVSSFDPALSQFGVDVKGNKWVETQEDGSINKTAFGAPYLVFKLPKIKAGESTADGKTWAAWARLYIPHMLVDGINSNSFLLRLSTDAKKWTPPNRGTRDIFWNDPMGENFAGQFPSNIPNDLTILTDVGTRLPWIWHKTWNGTPESIIQVVLEVGDNYAEVGTRESDPVNYPLIDVTCFRNDGNKPSDAEAKGQVAQSVQSAGKIAIKWGMLKKSY